MSSADSSKARPDGFATCPHGDGLAASATPTDLVAPEARLQCSEEGAKPEHVASCLPPMALAQLTHSRSYR